jgi:dTMP kinase
LTLNKGKIIVVEGIDKAGKYTQSRLLIDALKLSGRRCTMMSFPDYTTPIGQEIKAFFDGKRNYAIELTHMLLSANRWEKKNEIESMIEKDNIIIMNRYYQSNIVYGVSHDLDLEWLLNLDKGLPKEDIVIILRVNPNTSYQRTRQYKEWYNVMPKKLLTKVNKNYHILAKRFNWKVVDGEKTTEQVHNEIMNIVKDILKV